jgi:UDP-N-acetylglucosamine 2-epimerase
MAPVVKELDSVVEKVMVDPMLRKQMQQQLAFLDSNKRLILVSGHRPENFVFPEKGYIVAAASAAVYPFLLWLRVAEPYKVLELIGTDSV